MIRYQLICARGDKFDAWFRESADCAAQVDAKQIDCPDCGSNDVTKALMTPAVRSRSQRQPVVPPLGPEAPQPPLPIESERIRLATGSEPALEKAMSVMREFAKKVRANADDVGRRFPEEARKIHYGETEPRSIVGEATTDEAKDLLEEGVQFRPLPVLPEERN